MLETVPTVPEVSEILVDLETSPATSKQISPAKRWVFTWCNYPEEWFSYFEVQSSKFKKYIIGKEVGNVSETPHLQGYVEFKNKLRPKGLFPTQIHWEKARKNSLVNFLYCSKEGDYITLGFPLPLQVLSSDQLFDWQKSIVKLIKTTPDDRSIYWFWEHKGGIGKTALTKYLLFHFDGLICSGKASDMKYMITKYHARKDEYPKLIIFDVPRCNLNYISFNGMEEIKNGCFASTKYESEMVLMNCPHVIVFANEPPDLSLMSQDRWRILELKTT